MLWKGRCGDKTLRAVPRGPKVDTEEEYSANKRCDKTRQGGTSLEKGDDGGYNERQPYYPDQPQKMGRAASGF